MKWFIYIFFFSVLVVIDMFPSGAKIMPRFMSFVTDMFAIIMCIFIALRLIGQRGVVIAPKYLALIALYVFTLVIGVILNWVRIEPLIVGIRFHFKYIPFFLMPIVFQFSAQDIERQLKFILVLLLLQLPMVILQRLVIFRGYHADFISGTLGVSSHLSVFLICSIAVVFAFHLRGEIDLKRFLLLMFWLFLPATLNETKSTLILFPLALILPAFFLPRIWASGKIRNLVTVGVVVVLLGTTFAVLFQQIEGYSVLATYEEEMEGQGYLYTGSQGGIGEKKIGRGDAILLALKDLSKDGAGLFFGLGPGNVVPIGNRAFLGDYVASKLRYRAEMITVTHQMWELGLIGVAIYLTFLFFLFRDALFLTKSSDLFGILGLGFTAVVTIVFLSVIYKNIIYFNALYALFWYFSGVIAARAHRLRGMVRAWAELRTHPVGLQYVGGVEAVPHPASVHSSRGCMDSNRTGEIR